MKQTFSKVDTESAKTFFLMFKDFIPFHIHRWCLEMRVSFGHVTRSFHHKKGSNHFLLLSSPLLFIQNFFSRGFVTKKPPIWLKSKWARHPSWQLPQKKASFFVAPHQNASFKKNQFFVKSPCACFIQRVGSKLPMVNNHGVANNLIVIFFTF